MFNSPEELQRRDLEWSRAVEKAETQIAERNAMKTRLIGFTFDEIHSLRLVIYNAREAFAQMSEDESEDFAGLMSSLNTADSKLLEAYETMIAAQRMEIKQ